MELISRCRRKTSWLLGSYCKIKLNLFVVGRKNVLDVTLTFNVHHPLHDLELYYNARKCAVCLVLAVWIFLGDGNRVLLGTSSPRLQAGSIRVRAVPRADPRAPPWLEAIARDCTVAGCCWTRRPALQIWFIQILTTKSRGATYEHCPSPVVTWRLKRAALFPFWISLCTHHRISFVLKLVGYTAGIIVSIGVELSICCWP